MSDNKKVDWITMNDSALRGGIMICGSTGAGKSVSALLPWVEQLLDFEPRPSFYIDDPKSTFADDFLNIVAKKGLESELRHYCFKGDVKINPIYKKNILRDGGFAEVSQMIRAAQLNFMGRESGDAKFWGKKAGDLIKNTLSFCAATMGEYFTLMDFYETLIEAGSRDFALEIHEEIQQGNFDEEEQQNLKFAAQYFEYEYLKMDEKIRSGITTTATTFLSQLMEYQASQIICPKKEDVTFWSFDDVVDQGKIFVSDIRNEGLAKAIGTMTKLKYQTSVLGRNTKPERRVHNKRLAVSVIDEYPCVASFGGGEALGDDTYRATGRSAGAVDMYAMQGHTSLYNAMNDEKASQTLLLNFRTHITLNTLDSKTADFFEKVGGEVDVQKENESFSESGGDVRKDPFTGEVVAKNQSVTRSISRSTEKKKVINAEKLAKLNTFEAVGLVFIDGVETKFYDNLCLKPSFLENKRTPHKEILNKAKGGEEKKTIFKRLLLLVASLVSVIFCSPAFGFDFPSVCSVVNTPQFESIMDFKISVCPCYEGGVCTRYTYYVPVTYLEVSPDSGSLFRLMPGAAMQLPKNEAKKLLTFGGIGDEGGYFYQGRTLTPPFSSLSLGNLPCGGVPEDKMCFDAISEDFGKNWNTPTGDQLQPQFLAWASLGQKLCALKGTASSIGGSPSTFSPAAPLCSFPLEFLPHYPPTTEPVCMGWGQLMPRTGFVDASSPLNAAVLAGARFKSVATDVMRSTPSHPDEKWQLIYPNSSGSFRRGQNLGYLAAKLVNERGRLDPRKSKRYLFAIWKKVSCCRNASSLSKLGVYAYAKAVCAGLK